MTDASKPPEPPNIQRSILSFAALVCVLVSLMFLYVLPQSDVSTAMQVFWLAVVGVSLFLASLFLRLPHAWRRWFPTPALPSAALNIGAGFVLCILATSGMLLLEKYGRTNYIPVVTLWLGGALCYASAFLPRLSAPPNVRAWLRGHWKELLAVAVLIGVAAVLRFYQLGEKPRVLNGDEGWLGMVALSTMKNPLANPFALWENFGAIYLQAVNWVFSWLGPTAFSLRLLPAISGTLAIPALYLLARQVAGRRVAWIAGFLLAISHAHMNFSRTAAVGYIHDTWILPLVLFLLLRGLEKRNSLLTAAAGILLGLQFSIYLTAQIFIPLIVLFALFILAFWRHTFPGAGRSLLAMAGGLLVMILPNLAYAASQPVEFFNRLNVSGTFQSGWLDQQVAATGQHPVEILAGRFLHAFFSLIYYPAIDFYNSPVPLISIITASLFLLGLGLMIWKIRSPRFLLLNLWFWGATMAIGVFAIPESADSYRMIVTLPVVMFCAAFAFEHLLEAFGMAWNRQPIGYAVTTGFLLINLLFFNVWEYRVDFAAQCRYGGDPQTRFSSYMGSYLHTLRRETTIYLLSDDVFRYGTHASANFLGLDRVVTNIPEPLSDLSLIPGDVLIASPNRVAELIAWERTHPGGELVYYFDCDTLLMASYQLP